MTMFRRIMKYHILVMKTTTRKPIALVIVVGGGNQTGGRGEMIATTDEAAGANQIQIQDLKSSVIFMSYNC